MTYAGAAYLFDFNGSSFLLRFLGFHLPMWSGYDNFGSSVDVSGNLIVSGARGRRYFWKPE